MKKRNSGLVLLMTCLLSFDVAALSFTPTEAEWLTWPEYCRARYVVSGAGKNSSFSSRVPTAVVRKWNGAMGKAWYGLHHYCAAKVELIRAKSAKGKRARKNLLESVVGESRFTLNRTPRTHPMTAEMTVTVAQALHELGRGQEALEQLTTVMELHPRYASLYTSGAVILKDNNQLGEAIEMLSAGNDATQGKSAEIHYFLGLMYFDKKNFAKSKEHAGHAYRLGYPLTGLRNKLKASGHAVVTTAEP